jgi:putative FmdB family regulatory protein
MGEPYRHPRGDEAEIDRITACCGIWAVIGSLRPDMPNYDFECEKCGKTFEAFQSMKDKAFETCPESACQMETWGHGKVKRLLGTGAGLIFKGSGFYITDYRSEGYKQAAKKEGGDSTSSATKSESKPAESKPAESKPAPKVESKPATT